MLVTQYEGSVIEDTGLIKMDFLGLKTLSIIKEAVENIRLSRSIEVDVDTIDINDPATYKLYSDGRLHSSSNRICRSTCASCSLLHSKI